MSKATRRGVEMRKDGKHRRRGSLCSFLSSKQALVTNTCGLETRRAYTAEAWFSLLLCDWLRRNLRWVIGHSFFRGPTYIAAFSLPTFVSFCVSLYLRNNIERISHRIGSPNRAMEKLATAVSSNYHLESRAAHLPE